MDFLREIISFIRARKKPWLIPVFVVLIVLGGLFVITQGTALAPFIYTLF